MKLEKNKHDHKLTQWLKVGIFALLMLAPLFASLTQTLYVTLNKNAKDSYYGETINQSQIVTPTQYDNNTEYLLYWSNITSYTQSPAPRLYVEDFNIVERGAISDTNYNYLTTNKDNIEGFVIVAYNNAPNIQFFGEDIQSVNLTSTSWVFSFKLISVLNNFSPSELRYIEYNKYSYLDNAFYYGVDQMTKSDLFNWTQNTALYTGIKAMTDNLQVETNAIAILLTYWMILTIIYIIIDIVTNMFTFLTHMIVRSE